MRVLAGRLSNVARYDGKCLAVASLLPPLVCTGTRLHVARRGQHHSISTLAEQVKESARARARAKVRASKREREYMRQALLCVSRESVSEGERERARDREHV
jgi:hypothetical protein